MWAGLWFGGVLAWVLTAWPDLRSGVTGLDVPRPLECWFGVGALGLGFLLGRIVRRSRLTLLVAGIGVAVASVVIALGTAMRLARPGELEFALALAASAGLALGALAPAFSARGRLLALVATLVGAMGVVAAEHFAGARISPVLRDALLVMLPAIAMFVATPRAGRRPWPVSLWSLLPAAAVAVGGVTLARAALPSARLPDEVVAASAVRFTRLQVNAGAAAIYDRSTQEMQLWHDGVLVDAEGPDRPQSPFLATILAGTLRSGDRVLVLGTGTGRLPVALQRAGLATCDVVDWRTTARPLQRRLVGVGPVADPRDADPSDGVGAESAASARQFARYGCRETLRRLPDGARQAVVLAEPLHAGAVWQCGVDAQAELRRVVGNGLLVQPFAMDRVSPSMLRALLAAAAHVHPWNGVLRVGDCAALLSAPRAPSWSQLPSFESWPELARWQAHEAHLGAASDLQRTWLGTVIAELEPSDPASASATDSGATSGPNPAPDSVSGADSGRRATLRVLHACLRPAPAMEPARSSQFLWWVDVRSRVRAAERTLRAAAVADGQRVRPATLPFLPLGSPSALLQAALALPDDDDVRFASPDVAALAAFAIDPTVFTNRPPVFAELPLPRRETGDLEELAGLPAPERLRELCSDTGAFATALRVRFPSACARALVAGLAAGPLPENQQATLRRLADPFVLAMAGEALAGRDAVGELLGLWRGDLAMPRALAAMVRAPQKERMTLAAALAGRRDALAVGTLADLLQDEAVDVRVVAAGSLRATAGDRIAYDPKWSRSKRFLAAERVRALHNRAP